MAFQATGEVDRLPAEGEAPPPRLVGERRHAQQENRPRLDASMVAHLNRSTLRGIGLKQRMQLEVMRRLIAFAPALCSEVAQLLEAHPQVSVSADFLNLVCKDEYKCEEVLPDIHGGCLYVSTDSHMKGVLRAVERPYPCKFAQMFVNAYFPGERCPTEEPLTSTMSLGGVSYATCVGGFVTKSGGCIEVLPLGATPESGVRVFMLDGHIGMPPTWHRSLSNHYKRQPSSARMVGRAGVVPAHTELKVNITVCEPYRDALNVSVEQLQTQVRRLTAGYSGQAMCQDPTAYSPPSKDMNLSFSLALPVNRVVDEKCGMCDWYYEFLWMKHTPQVPGQIKVLFCQADAIVGFSAFPDSQPRGIMIDYRTLPGGAYQNYNLGNTLIHEMGHYLGLLHTFQDGCEGPGDLIADTNSEASPFFGCPNPSEPRHSCQGVDPFHNFMDYTDDRCMCSFTELQKQRIWDTMGTYMSDLVPSADRAGTHAPSP